MSTTAAACRFFCRARNFCEELSTGGPYLAIIFGHYIFENTLNILLKFDSPGARNEGNCWISAIVPAAISMVGFVAMRHIGHIHNTHCVCGMYICRYGTYVCVKTKTTAGGRCG